MTTMTFHPDELQADLLELVETIVGKQTSDDHVAAIDAEAGAWDTALYSALVDAGVLAAIIGDDGEGGMGVAAAMLVQIVLGQHLARVPFASTVAGGLAAARAGHAELAQQIAGGDITVGLALPGPRDILTIEHETLTGTADMVVAGADVTHYLAVINDDAAWLVPANAAGVETTPMGFSYRNNTGVEFAVATDAAQELTGLDADWLRWCWWTLLAATVTGACQEAVARTAAYTSQRHQFGQPLSHKQGVLLQAADAHIATEAIRLVTMQAAVALDQTTPENSREAGIAATAAAWWANDAGVRAVHITQHLHGGMGADTDNQIHRFFVLVRELALVLGSADQRLGQLGALALGATP